MFLPSMPSRRMQRGPGLYRRSRHGPIRCAPGRLGSVDLRRAPARCRVHRLIVEDEADTRLYVDRERRRRGDEVHRLRPQMGLARRGAALDLLHAAPAKRRSLERGHHLVVVGRNGDVPVWARCGAPGACRPIAVTGLRDHRQCIAVRRRGCAGITTLG